MPQHTTVINSDAPIRSVSFFDEEERGMWFPFPKSVIRSGRWRSLSPAAKALLPVMCLDIDPLHPRNPHTLCTASDDELCALANIQRSALYEARKTLSDLGLIRKIRAGVWEVCVHVARRGSPPSPPTPSPLIPSHRLSNHDSASPPAWTLSPPAWTPDHPKSPPGRTESPPALTPNSE